VCMHLWSKCTSECLFVWQMIFLPEAFDYIAENQEDTVALSEGLDGPIVTRYKAVAAQYKVWLFLGGLHERLVSVINLWDIIIKYKYRAGN
jgi:hypothetical protein